MTRRILVALDGLAAAAAVLAQLSLLFRFVDWEVDLFRVPGGPPLRVRNARRHLDRALAKARAHLAEPNVVTLLGPPADALLMHAVTGGFDLIAVGAQGRLAHELIRKSPMPVFVARPEMSAREVRTILVPLDGSLRARRALSPAAMLAGAAHGKLALMTAVPDGKPVRPAMMRLEKIRQDLAGPSESVVAFGDPARTILEREDAQLVVIATHGGTASGRRKLGRVTEAVLRGSRVPVVVVPTAGPLKTRRRRRSEDGCAACH